MRGRTMRLMYPAEAAHGSIGPRLRKLLVATCALAFAAASCATADGTGDQAEAPATTEIPETSSDDWGEARGDGPIGRFLDLDAGPHTPYSCGVRVDGSLVC